MASIRLEGIQKDFPGVKALDNINITIESGEFFTLLGPSGCGKTTLLRTVAGFYKQDAGHVYVADELIDTKPAHARNTGMVFQNYAVFPHMTVFENVAFGLKTRKVPGPQIKERVAQALENARLSGLEARTPDQLSGGQQQRVGLARAMVIEPKVLLMDEPLSNLDAKLRVEMREEIREIQHNLGITTIYVTHDQEEALVISDRIAVMNFGVVQQIAAPWDIYKEPANTFVASFVGNTNFIDAEVVSANGNEMTVAAGGTQIRVRSAGSGSGKLKLAVRPEDLGIDHAGAEKPGHSMVTGTVEIRTFTGSQVQYTVNDGEGLSFLVQRHRPEAGAMFSVGDQVSVLIPSDSVMCFDLESGDRL